MLGVTPGDGTAWLGLSQNQGPIPCHLLLRRSSAWGRERQTECHSQVRAFLKFLNLLLFPPGRSSLDLLSVAVPRPCPRHLAVALPEPLMGEEKCWVSGLLGNPRTPNQKGSCSVRQLLQGPHDC